jgi:RimJ/RimL family protein N-acetyltransferase
MRQSGQIVELRDGTRALIRPIGPQDRERLNEGFESASRESIFMRFLAPLHRLSSRQLDYLTAVDHARHEALIALDPDTGQSFGTARYVRSDDDPATAEFAVGVGDQWMRTGLGTALLSALVVRARQGGVTRLTGTVHPDNTAVKRFIEKVLGPFETRSTSQGVQEIVIDLSCEGPWSEGAKAAEEASEGSAPPRSRAQRRIDVLAKLCCNVDLWVASASDVGEANVAPLSYYWDGSTLTVATPRASRTGLNLVRAGWARVALGPTRDVVIIEGPVEAIPIGADPRLEDAHARVTGFDPRTLSDEYVYLRITPREIQAWRESNELAGRQVMRNGEWLA